MCAASGPLAPITCTRLIATSDESLNHRKPAPSTTTTPTTTARYAHVADEPKHEVVETVAGIIAPSKEHGR